MKYFIYTVITVVAAMVIVGFFIVGSPKEERMRQFDERRVNDLSSLQYEVINYWQSKLKLPAKLDELNNDIRGFTVYTDPETGVPYEYAVKGDKTFELCATFALQSDEAANTINAVPAAPISAPIYKDGYRESWKHSSGRTCFDRTIDPDLYPPIKK